MPIGAPKRKASYHFNFRPQKNFESAAQHQEAIKMPIEEEDTFNNKLNTHSTEEILGKRHIKEQAAIHTNKEYYKDPESYNLSRSNDNIVTSPVTKHEDYIAHTDF